MGSLQLCQSLVNGLYCYCLLKEADNTGSQNGRIVSFCYCFEYSVRLVPRFLENKQINNHKTTPKKLNLKFADDSFITHNIKTQITGFDTIKYDSNIAFHCVTWSFSQGIRVYCCQVRIMELL